MLDGMTNPLPLWSSRSVARTFTATVIAIVLVAANFTVINAQQQSSDRGLTASINGGSFTTGDTITISGSVAQRGSSSNVVIEITDPQGQQVKRGFPSLSATDNTFTYSFVAGEQEQFDTNAPMVASGNYLVKVRYFPPGDGVVIEEVELSFVYNPASGGAAASSNGGTAQPSSSAPIEPIAPVTTSSSQQTPIQNTTVSPTGIAAALTFFQSTNDSFSINVPQGWQIQDLNNSGSLLTEESTRGYGILAQLCPEDAAQQPITPTNFNNTDSCIAAEGEVMHIVRYPNLNNGVMQAANNVTSAATGASFDSNNTQSTTASSLATVTIDNILAYHLLKLQEVGYRNIQIVNNLDTRVNLTTSQTNQTITTLPAKFGEIVYTTASAPGEIKRGYFVLTATNATAPNFGITKGYSVFYEGNVLTPADITTTSSGLSSLPPMVGQVFDSFELIVAPEVEQALTPQATVGQTGVGGDASCHPSYPDDCIPPPPPPLNCDSPGVPTNFRVVGSDPHGFDGDNDGIGCETTGLSSGSGTTGAPGGTGVTDDDDDGGDSSCHPSYPDDCIPPPPPNLNCGDPGVPTNFRVVGSDPHGFDGDNDGIGCDAPGGGDDDDGGGDPGDGDGGGDGDGDGDGGGDGDGDGDGGGDGDGDGDGGGDGDGDGDGGGDGDGDGDGGGDGGEDDDGA